MQQQRGKSSTLRNKLLKRYALLIKVTQEEGGGLVSHRREGPASPATREDSLHNNRGGKKRENTLLSTRLRRVWLRRKRGGKKSRALGKWREQPKGVTSRLERGGLDKGKNLHVALGADHFLKGRTRKGKIPKT